MKYTNNEIVARKQLAIAASTYLVVAGFDHVTMSITTYSADVTVFTDTEEQVKDAAKKCRPFIPDGAGYSIKKSHTEGRGDFYYLTIEWL